MHFFDVLAVLVSLSAVFSWLNERFLKLPTAIGLMLIALGLSLLLLLPIPFGETLRIQAQTMIAGIDFNETLLHGMLSFLLFAGALHINLHDLARHKWVIGLLATAGVFVTMLLVGIGSYGLLLLFGIELPFIYCLLFGALIAPTDPIAVLGVIKTVGAPKSLEIKIAGESLFNDGVAVVVFMVLFGVVTGAQVGAVTILTLFLQEALGGVLFGLLVGWLATLMLRRVDQYQVEVLITLAVASGGYALAEHFHLSAPIAVVIAGLMIGNQGTKGAMSASTREHLGNFWELVDESLNAVLFVLIGLEVLVIIWHTVDLFAAAVMIPLVLIARALSISLPLGLMHRWRSFSPATVFLLTWGGLRGGISIALALSLPAGEPRQMIVTMTYAIVVFSILVQGLTLAPAIRALGARADAGLDRG